MIPESKCDAHAVIHGDMVRNTMMLFEKMLANQISVCSQHTYMTGPVKMITLTQNSYTQSQNTEHLGLCI